MRTKREGRRGEILVDGGISSQWHSKVENTLRTHIGLKELDIYKNWLGWEGGERATGDYLVHGLRADKGFLEPTPI